VVEKEILKNIKNTKLLKLILLKYCYRF